MTLADRVALVTGASIGLGAEIAEHFAAAGASLVICARNAAELEAQRERISRLHPGTRIVSLPADVSEEKDVDRVFETTVQTFGKLDVLVNNAGVYGPMGAIDQVDWNDWVHAIKINLIGTVYCARKATELMRARRYGKIINLSGGGATNPLPGISAYAASKAAVVRFTETLALELQSDHVDVNAVAPGALATRLTDQLLSAGPDKVGSGLHQRMEKLKRDGGTPLSLGAKLCVYLASAESDGLTGRLIAAPWDPWPFADAVKTDIAAGDIYTLRRIVPEDRGKEWAKS